jgi:hypothetical protein
MLQASHEPGSHLETLSHISVCDEGVFNTVAQLIIGALKFVFDIASEVHNQTVALVVDGLVLMARVAAKLNVRDVLEKSLVVLASRTGLTSEDENDGRLPSDHYTSLVVSFANSIKSQQVLKKTYTFLTCAMCALE